MTLKLNILIYEENHVFFFISVICGHVYLGVVSEGRFLLEPLLRAVHLAHIQEAGSGLHLHRDRNHRE
jgi:hypothetical protein